MIDYETIYQDATHAAYSAPGLFGEKARQAALTAGIAAVVAAAKREALEEAAVAVFPWLGFDLYGDPDDHRTTTSEWLRGRAEGKRTPTERAENEATQ